MEDGKSRQSGLRAHALLWVYVCDHSPTSVAQDQMHARVRVSYIKPFLPRFLSRILVTSL
jgi:hypothetical protein